MGVIGVMGLLIFFLYNQMNYNKEMLLIETVKNTELTVALEETKNSLTKQIQQLNSLSTKNQQYEVQMAEYLDIFRRHDMAQLARDRKSVV